MKKHESSIEIAKLGSSEPSWVLSNPAAGFGGTQQGWVRRDPTGFIGTQARFPKTQPSWVRRGLQGLVGTQQGRPSQAGFQQDPTGWVRCRHRNPAWWRPKARKKERERKKGKKRDWVGEGS
ncbi:hypothetical protein SLEP1_g11230 [Rubroshorea leprosula]|uniref:Uncharacterized protein n=1 Tax=Rubroshorea leprosula TaxID=152421 RepID=A0AAV5IAN7_9ROSI|nr:hypothetical protein SLEP1_g11230 [Rubroshorea leprosula]